MKIGTQMWDRAYELILDDIVIKDLDISFNAIRNTETEPNTLDLEILNLSKNTRKKLEDKKKFLVQLKAGYKGSIGTVFLGQVREISSTHSSTEWVTTISSGDGEDAKAESRVNKSYGPGASVANVMQDVARSMQVEQGNLTQNLARGRLVTSKMPTFVNGITVSGPAHKEFDRICKSAGLEWSIQENKLQILPANKALQTLAVVLTPNNGLIGSPTISSDGTLNALSLINSDIIPGKQLVIQSEHVNGRFRAEKCTYKGQTSGQDWYIEIEGKELKI